MPAQNAAKAKAVREVLAMRGKDINWTSPASIDTN
jgi:hypothetical protein